MENVLQNVERENNLYTKEKLQKLARSLFLFPSSCENCHTDVHKIGLFCALSRKGEYFIAHFFPRRATFLSNIDRPENPLIPTETRNPLNIFYLP